VIKLKVLDYQKRAEEDERDEVRNGDVTAALFAASVGRLWITFPFTHARQHDLLPALTSGAPVM